MCKELKILIINLFRNIIIYLKISKFGKKLKFLNLYFLRLFKYLNTKSLLQKIKTFFLFFFFFK